MLLQKDAVFYEAFGFFPAALQFVQVEIIGGAILQAGSNPWTPVVSYNQVEAEVDIRQKVTLNMIEVS